MSYNDQMRQKLKSNIIVVSIFLGISLIFLGLTLYDILFTDLLEEQTSLILKDTLPMFFSGYGLLGLGASIFVYKKFDDYYPQQQVSLFMFLGILFLPFTIILLVVGIMKYLEKAKFQKQFFTSFVLGLLAVGLIWSISITQLAKAEGAFVNKHVIESRYEIDENNYIDLTVTGFVQGSEVLKITYDAVITMDDPKTLTPDEFGRLVESEGLRISMNRKQTCVIYAYSEAVNQYSFSCEQTEFTEEGAYAYTATDFISFEDLYIEIGEVYDDYTLNERASDGQFEILSKVVTEKAYQEYLDTFEDNE